MDLSIIIPTYNRLWSLPDAIASCPAGEGIEIIVVDDGSTDGTWDWLGSRSDIIAVRQSNQGKPAAVNKGFSHASGRYIRFLDSDDLLIGDAVRAQLERALLDGPDISVAGYVEVDTATDRKIIHEWHDCGDFVAQQLGECDSSHYSAYLFRRAFVDRIWHRPEFAFRDDRMYVIECALNDPVVAVFDEPTLIHRHHARERIQFQPGSVAVVTNWQELRMFRLVAAWLEERGGLSDRRRAAIANNLWPLGLRIAAHHRQEGRQALDWLWSLYPDFRIPPGRINDLHRLFGYSVAQPMVNGARSARNLARRLTRRVQG